MDFSWAANLDFGSLVEDDGGHQQQQQQQQQHQNQHHQNQHQQNQHHQHRNGGIEEQLNDTQDLFWPPVEFEEHYTDGFNNISLFALDTFEDTIPANLQDVSSSTWKRKRPGGGEDEEESSLAKGGKRREVRTHAPSTQDSFYGVDRQDSSRDLLTACCPELFPSLPLPVETPPTEAPIGDNPFHDGCTDRYSSAARLTFTMSVDGGVDGYIKFRLRAVQEKDEPQQKQKANSAYDESGMGVHHHHHSVLPIMETEKVMLLPKDFGLTCKLGSTEKKLMKFYTVAFCTGRTLIAQSNFWLKDVTAVADQDPGVRNALLASTAAYVLDYLPSDALRTKADMYYKRAVALLTTALAADKTSTQVQDREIPVLTSLLLLSCDNVVNWELNAPRDMQPKWLQGTRMSKAILDRTDPGYRYWKACNVQSSVVRDALANRIAFMSILAQPVSPLEADNSGRLYGWLLEGTAEETQRVRAGTGLCPKLLHTFAQITQIAARLLETPDTLVLEAAIERIEGRLTFLHQHSELSDGYQDPFDLFASCTLDSQGKVNSILKVTELTAEAWRAAAQLYLHCRLLRKPRHHHRVLHYMDILRGCIERMPYTGPLFSSQAPFFPISLLAMLSYRAEDRRVATEWFETVTSGAGCRSSVPPIWKVVQNLWAWMATELHESGGFDAGVSLKEREPWWERVVGYLIEHEGVMSLC